MTVVGFYLEIENQWELSSINKMITLLRAASGPSGTKTTMLDIGANYGIYSISAACHVPHCRAYAFECNPDTLGILRDNVAQNSTSMDQSGSSVTVVDKAVSSQSGISHFQTKIDDGHGTLDINNESDTSHFRNVIDVPTIDGDWMIKNLDFETIDFCKIDVEGAEKAVITGLRNLLSEKRIKHIQIEVMSNNSVVLDELLNYGYILKAGDHAIMHKVGMEDFYLTAEE